MGALESVLETVESVMKAMDGDGNGTLDYAEFEATVKELTQQTLSRALTQLFCVLLCPPAAALRLPTLCSAWTPISAADPREARSGPNLRPRKVSEAQEEGSREARGGGNYLVGAKARWQTKPRRNNNKTNKQQKC